MSAIAGVYSRRGAPIDRNALAAISQGMRQLGPDGEWLSYSGSVGMACRPFFTDRASRAVRQPVATSDGYMLAFDGRLDNARDLRRRLGTAGMRRLPDVEVVLAAYRAWGIEGFAHLIGDFAFALWDGGSARLVLCCDALGRRALYYHVTTDFIAWASQGRPLLKALNVPFALDDGFIADFLTNRAPSASPFHGIDIVPGGHVLVATEGKVERVRYWSIDPDREIRYRSDAEYEHHFFELFREAVACRLRADGPVFCELSGGIDSSAIACVANGLARRGSAGPAPLRTVSYTFDQSASSDETSYIQMVERRIGRGGIHIGEAEAPVLARLPASFAADVPTSRLCFLSRYDGLSWRMREAGARVLLSGVGGDQLFWSEHDPMLPLGDLLARGQWIEWLRACAQWAELLRLPFLKMLWLGISRPFRSGGWQGLVQRGAPLGEWFDPTFTRQTELRTRMLPASDELRFRVPSAAIQYALIRRAMRPFALEWFSSESYVDVRHPFLDRRLVEFAVAIPLEQKIRPGESRSIVRRALEGIVPDPVLTRRTKAGPGEALYRALAREWSWLSTMFSDPLVAEYGFVDRDAFRLALHRARHGISTNQAQLLRTISLELWLGTLERHPRTGDTAPPGRRHSLPQGGSHVAAAQDLRSA